MVNCICFATRNGKRTAQAALIKTLASVDEGMRTEEEAAVTIDPRNLDTASSAVHSTLRL